MRKNFKYLWLALILSLGLILAIWVMGVGFVPVAHASSCTVGTSHTSIQAAVNDSNCDLIILPAGTYFENITIDRSLTLQGAGASSAVIDGSGSGRVIDITAGTVFISGVTVQNGKLTSVGSIGAGILNLGNLTLTNTTINSNTATQGSGIYSYEGVLELTNSTVSSNESFVGGLGGAIFGEYSTLILNNSTVSGNKGGGIVSVGDGGTLTLNNSTVSNNTEGSGILGNGILKNTIVANNGGGVFISSDCNGAAFTSAGYNLDSDNTCNLTATGDITNTNPLLGPLQDNGGATETHALLPGSPAIDTGSCTVATTDQRDKYRPVDIANVANADNGCDIGAYEAQSELTLTKAVDNPKPAQGQQINYIITVNNSGDISATNALISDTLPVSITFAGPVSLDPPQASAILATSALSLPTLASNVTITAQTSITVTLPVTVNLDVTTNTFIINSAAVTSAEISIPVEGKVCLGACGEMIYLPIVLKN